MRRRKCLQTIAASLCVAAPALGCRPKRTPTTPPSPRSPRRDDATAAQENLTAFARLYGYVRFFHPSLEGERADWKQLAVTGCRAVRSAATIGELDALLARVFATVAPSLQTWVEPDAAPPRRRALSRADGVVYWQHLGFEGSPLTTYRPPYAQVRVTPDTLYRRRFTERPSDDAVIEAAIMGPLWARVPMVLAAGGEVAPRDAERPMTRSAPPPELDDAADPDIRAAAVVEAWNVLRHFYPYQEEVSVDWPGALAEGLADAEAATGQEGLRRALERLVARLEDGHGQVGLRRSHARAALPFALDLVEGKAAVVASSEPALFALGDVIESVGGAPCADAIEELAARFSGSPQWRTFRAAAWEFPRGRDTATTEVVRRRGTVRSTLRVAYRKEEPPVPPRPEPLDELAGGVAYVDLTRLAWSALHEALPTLADAPAVVFDLRGYPVHNDQVIDHLLREPEDAQWMHVPRIIEPDGAVVAWKTLGWNRSPRQPHIRGHAVFLVSPGAISYAESILSYVQTHKLATLVGQPSAGANGDIVRLDTVGGVYLIFTGMRVTRHDGRRFHGEGVRPDIAAGATLAGLAAGRDEVLEAALAHLAALIEEAPTRGAS